MAMAAKVVQSMSEFDLGEDWVEYGERFEMFLIANGVTDVNIKRAVFLSTIGSGAYKLLQGLVGEAVKTKTFEELCQALREHLKPAPNVIAERFRFFKRDRTSGETVNAYIAELRRLSEHCEFKTELNTYLRDRFVCGLNNENVQQKLLASEDLTLEKALTTARSFESTSRDARMFHGGGSAAASMVDQVGAGGDVGGCGSEEVHRLHQQPARGGKTDTRECFKCGKVGHISPKCPYASYTCHRCGKVGHLEKRCRLPEKPGASRAAPRAASVHRVCTCSASNDQGHGIPDIPGEGPLSVDGLHLYALQGRSDADPVMVEVLLNGQSV